MGTESAPGFRIGFLMPPCRVRPRRNRYAVVPVNETPVYAFSVSVNRPSLLP
jgi:hypothetical protein